MMPVPPFLFSPPLSISGSCLGLVLASGCVGMAASSLVQLDNDFYYLYHLILAFFSVFSILPILRLPESKRKPLPDYLEEGENQRRPPIVPSPPGSDKQQQGPQAPWKDYRRNKPRLEFASEKTLTEHDRPDGISQTPPASLSDNETQEQEYETLTETESETPLSSGFDISRRARSDCVSQESSGTLSSYQ